MSYITIQRIAYMHADKDILFGNINLSVNKGEKVALVGNNGSGKSTLLKIIAGRLKASEGTVMIPSSGLYYVPQHFGQYNEMTIAQALQVEDKLQALQAILKGETDEKLYDILNDDWNIEERIHAALSTWGLASFDLSHPMQTLSGGEKTKVFLAGMEIHAESVILLDEPTNHLDYSYRQKLYSYIQSSRSTMMIVSHDRTLLNLLSVTCELSANGITVYGGNYEFYKEQKSIALQALQQKLEEKEKQFRLAQKTAREAAERQQKHDVRGEKHNIKKGVSRIAMGNLKSKAENSTAKLKGIHTEKVESIQGEVRQLRTSIPMSSVLKTDFNSSSLHTGKVLVTAQEINFGYHNTPLWKEPLSFQIRSGDRIAISGNNGSGKTTLLKLITGKLTPTAGVITRADQLSYVYMDQEYSIIQAEKSILEQAESFNLIPLPDHELKTILNRFLFPADVWNKPCNKLSGGEKMRLAFCCLMISNNTPDIFILDEPTNNLDIQNIEMITSTIKQYTGTVIVISHDKYFMNEIGVDRGIDI
ncbi:ribosomal protection-like ABC-F family protein [Bacteroides sp. 224]|uniref:ribosomal protection-like ABC-F family protein n=1 Tax=Bacteroides sp. 224 TaxID=2302936 RepID=UPI0013D849D9|nr:ABC-F family ATP-binding cassette domain-containing protein [Bacteroides sp. 224]NDV66611.1 ABC transporter ATP-binding protein [Bacteroides sp. 224]